jgi:hypothetical protein
LYVAAEKKTAAAALFHGSQANGFSGYPRQLGFLLAAAAATDILAMANLALAKELSMTAHARDELLELVHVLQSRIAKLETELGRRRPRRSVGKPAAVFVGLLLGLAAGRGLLADAWSQGQGAAKAAPDIVCKSLRLVDANGKEVAVFGTNKFGGYCQFKSAQGQSQVYAGADAEKGGGAFHLFGPNGNRLVTAGHDDDGGVVRINNHEEKGRAYFWVGKGGKAGLINIVGEANKSAIMISGDDLGGYINFNNAEGKVRLVTGVNKEGGAAIFYGNEGKRRIYAGTNINGGAGLIDVLGTDERSRVVIAVDQNDVGFVDGRDNSGTTRRSLR